MKFLFAIIGAVLTLGMAQAQTISGRVVDNQNQPVPFANILTMDKDSAFINGTVSDEEGRFQIPFSEKNAFVKVSYIGFHDLIIAIHAGKFDLGDIMLREDTQLLDEVVVRGNLPKTHIKGEAMITNISGSLLEKAGTAIDVLAKVPGLTLEGENINVFGRGTPQIYINGREVRDATELNQLTSDNIRSVEVITNPGVRYDKTVRAVVRIQTKKAADDGLGFSNRTNVAYNDKWSYLSQLNLYYRQGNFDLNGMVDYSDQRSWRKYDGIQQTYLDSYWEQLMKADQTFNNRRLTGNLALNYTINPDHSVGAAYRLRRYPRYKNDMQLETGVTQNGSFWENSQSDILQNSPETRHESNIYYNGKAGQWDIDLNGTWIETNEKVTTQTIEAIQSKEEPNMRNAIHTFSNTRNTLYAGKLVLAYPLWDGTFSVGSEYSHTSRSSLYENEEGIVANDDSRIKEGLVAAFSEYEKSFGKINVQMGVRFENVDFNYYQSGTLQSEQSKNYTHVFPALSLSTVVGNTQLQLSYSSDITRPDYQLLRSRVDYVNRYTFESGNPFLQPALTHTIALKAAHKWLLFYADWNHLSDAIIQHSETYAEDDPTLALMKPENAPAYKAVNVMLNASPTIGCWSPQIGLGMYKQWYTVEKPGAAGETLSLNKPSFSGSWENGFELPLGIILNADVYWRGRAEQDNASYKSTWWTNCSLSKDFFASRLTLLLQANDIFNTNRYNLFMYYGHLRATGLDQKYSRQSIGPDCTI